MVLPQHLRTALDAIRRDDRHGAAWLSRAAADALGAAAAHLLPAQIPSAALLVAESQPAMAPLQCLAKRVRRARSGVDLQEICRRFSAESRAADQAIARYAAQLIRPGATVMTHSASQAVEATLLAVPAIRVWATASEPAREGADLASRLTTAGLETRIVPDLEALDTIVHADLFLVGADAISPRGVVNKRGTRELTLAAREHGIPAFCLASSHKLTPRHLDVGELFDETPLSAFVRIVTESGPRHPTKSDLYTLTQ